MVVSQDPLPQEIDEFEFHGNKLILKLTKTYQIQAKGVEGPQIDEETEPDRVAYQYFKPPEITYREFEELVREVRKRARQELRSRWIEQQMRNQTEGGAPTE